MNIVLLSFYDSNTTIYAKGVYIYVVSAWAIVYTVMLSRIESVKNKNKGAKNYG